MNTCVWSTGGKMTGKTEVCRKNLSQPDFIHHKCHIDWPRNETRPLQWQASHKLPEPSHGHCFSSYFLRWMQHVPLKRWGPCTQRCGVTSQKTSSFNFIKQHWTSQFSATKYTSKETITAKKHDPKEFIETLSPISTMNRFTSNAGRQWELFPLCPKNEVPGGGRWIKKNKLSGRSSCMGKFCYDSNGRNGSYEFGDECSEQHTHIVVWRWRIFWTKYFRIITTFHNCNNLNSVTITVAPFLIQMRIQIFRVSEHLKTFKKKHVNKSFKMSVLCYCQSKAGQLIKYLCAQPEMEDCMLLD